MFLLIVIRITVLVTLQVFYRHKYILKENGRVLFEKFRVLRCTKTFLRVSLLS